MEADTKEMSLALRQFEAMIAENTKGLSPSEAAALRDELMNNPVLNNYYSQPNKIIVTLDGEVVSTLPCERVALEYPQQDEQDASQWQNAARGQVNIARTRDGDIWAHIKNHELGRSREGQYTRSLFHSSDGGRTWHWTEGSSSTGCTDFAFTILQDDTFLVAGEIRPDQKSNVIHRSCDRGKTWEHIATILPIAPFGYIGADTSGMTQLSDGTILFTTQCCTAADWRGGPRGHLVCRSTDGGQTWSVQDVTWPAHQFTADGPEFPAQVPIVDSDAIRWLHSCESSILELSSGRLLHTMRFHIMEEPPDEAWWKVHKSLGFLDSDDGGLTWKNIRPALDAKGQPALELEAGECHGKTVQLTDGRLVLVHDHRYPHRQAETIARVSHDEGRTWDRRAYHLAFGNTYPMSVVLEDDTIVTVTGTGLFDDVGHPITSKDLWTCAAIRWKLPPAGAE